VTEVLTNGRRTKDYISIAGPHFDTWRNISITLKTRSMSEMA